MGATKKLLEETHYLEVNNDYYKEHFDLFFNENVKHIRTTVKDDMFKDDENHKVLLKKYLKSRDDLRNYEYDKRHNHKY